MGLGLGLSLWGSTVGHPSNCWASCYFGSMHVILSYRIVLLVILIQFAKFPSKLPKLVFPDFTLLADKVTV